MTTPSIVRIAGSSDLQEVFRLLLEGHRENGLFSYDLDKVHWWVSRMLSPETIPEWDTGPRGVIGVIGEPENLEALAFLTIGCFWYSSQRHLEEFIVYVDRRYRASRHAKSLIKWMKDQSIATGLPLMTGILSMHQTEEKIHLYERMLPKAGAFFCFDPITVTAGSTLSTAVH